MLHPCLTELLGLWDRYVAFVSTCAWPRAPAGRKIFWAAWWRGMGTRSAVPPVRFAVFPALHALLVDAVVVAVETAAVISFRVFSPLELALGAGVAKRRCSSPRSSRITLLQGLGHASETLLFATESRTVDLLFLVRPAWIGTGQDATVRSKHRALRS